MSKPAVSDALWTTTAPLLPTEPPTPKGGRSRRISDWVALTGILFVLNSASSWEMLPHELGWQRDDKLAPTERIERAAAYLQCTQVARLAVPAVRAVMGLCAPTPPRVWEWRWGKERPSMFSPRRPTPAPSHAPLLPKPAETAETAARARKPPTRRTRRALVSCLPLVSLLLTGMSCSNSTVIIPITHSQASELRLSVTIRDQYSDKPTVQVFVEIRDATTNQPVGLAQPAHLSCNGQDIMPTIQGSEHSCPRQQPGGAYHIAYTDEHGTTTAVPVPVPKDVFALLSPQPGARVPIPTNGALSVRFSTPLPASQGNLDDSVIVLCGASQQLCGEVVGPTLNNPGVTPSVANGTVVTPTPNLVTCPASPTLNGALVTVRGNQATVNVIGDFGTFQPGPGAVSIGISQCTMADPAGFASVRVTFADNLTAPITWVR